MRKLVVAVLALVAAWTAVGAHAAADRLHRWSLRLRGLPEPVDQHLSDAQRLLRSDGIHRQTTAVDNSQPVAALAVLPDSELPATMRALLHPLFHGDRIADPWIPLDQAAASLCTDLSARGLQIVRRST